jgi:glutamine synthetase
MRRDETGLLLEQIAADDVRFVRLQFTDIEGRLKNVSVPASRCEKALTDGIWFDGSSIEGFARIEESDMLLVPDPSTYCVLPWNPEKAREARLICDIRDYSGKPFAGDPRHVLKLALAGARDMGFDFLTGPELEFWLFKTSSLKPQADFHDDGSYFDLFPVDNGVEIRRDIVLTLTEMGFGIEASHHEVAKSQHEICIKYGPALATADRIVTFKHVARTIALKYGVLASFIAKPKAGINGNALHIHSSLVRNGRNVFYDPDAPHQISDTALRYIGGLLAHARGLCRIANPTINSFKRLTPGYEAPCTVSWSEANRSALVRVPAARGEGTRVELRNPDAMCNPYLLLAGMLTAGMDGIRNGILPPDSTNKNVYDCSERERERLHMRMLPADLMEAHECLLADNLLCDMLGRHIVDGLTRISDIECQSFRTAVHPWEIARYFHTT